ncbi:MAG: diphthine--ammonia ligase [Candidatus Thermoplasmatota archaeon]|jgi:ABC transporter with metal-binding/Fe-S-binding domain ATP-binding protein|nr:diphthine--ammonia ligase [Candidatus Thermoplasmatota archaeon]MCL5874086.1 diphthine--ammonia ligase [Candidatus Thermoplasmatota archaeon]
MKAISLLSGGKDSFMSLLIAISLGMEVERTITVKADQDSYMFHYPNAELGRTLSEMMGIQNALVSESNFYEILSSYSGSVLIAGAVESEFQKTKLEELCDELGLKTFFPLWRRNQESIILDFISTGSKAIFVSVAAEGLDERLLGREIDQDALNFLKEMNSKYGISIVGEGGEYETLVTCSPFANDCIEILESEIVDRGIQKNLRINRTRMVSSL